MTDSQLPAAAADTAGGNLETLVAKASPGYWHYVSKAFYRTILVRLAVLYAFAVASIAVVVPFLASSLPYTVEIKDASGTFHRIFPLFRALTTVDLGVLVLAACVVAFYIVNRQIRERPLEERSRISAIAGLVILAVLVIGNTALPILHSDYHDASDYKAMIASGDARGAIFAPVRWGYSDAEPLENDMVYKQSSSTHPLGTDGNGQDALARLLWACRIVLSIGLIAELISVFIGIIYGALMGYFSGTVDILGMRFVEMIESIPTLFLIIIFVAIFGRKIWIITLILGVTGWTGLARFVRAEYLRIRQLDYVSAAVASGVPLRSVLFRHILPNALSPILVVVSFGIAGAITSESILSFLGLGLEPPTPSWGIMLNEAGNPAEIFRPWLALPPGMMIFLTTFACNIIGEALRDALDPKLNRLQ